MTDPKVTPRFDTSLALFAEAMVQILGLETVEKGWILRNSEGHLTFIALEPLPDDLLKRAAEAAIAAAGPYCLEDFVATDAQSPGVSGLIKRSRPYREAVSVLGQSLYVNLIDQRIVGADWLLAPANSSLPTPRYAFASIKGGVGRTTALAVAATHFAEAGKKVLVIDLDLEAPGIGAMMLPPNELPAYGLLDGYIERSLGNFDDSFLFDMMAPSPFGKGKGLIDVVPAVGATAQEHPANVLAKLARAYVESSTADGALASFSDQTRWLVDTIAGSKQYDAVLVDVRAGLNESTAAALLGLGAQVLLFGEDTPQTFAGYRYLLAHLARSPRNFQDDWLVRLKMVHAKASPLAERQQAFRDRAHDLFREFLYRDIPLGEDSSSPVLDQSGEGVVTMPEFSLDDVEAPHYAVPILRDSNYFEFDPLSAPSQLSAALYERTYAALLDRLIPA